jgi:flavin reductase (DIM6/NTAB) family NADH-FMN oxidoreductase RutF
VDPTTLRRVLAAFPTGVTALAALVDGEPVGMAANSFTSVSLDPPLVSVCVATTSTTWPTLRRASRIGVSVLSHEQEAASRSLAARGIDRFAGLSWHATDDGAILLSDASAWFDCSVEREIRAGDHEIVLLACTASAPIRTPRRWSSTAAATAAWPADAGRPRVLRSAGSRAPLASPLQHPGPDL